MEDHSIERLLVRVADLERRLEASAAVPIQHAPRRRRAVLVAGLVAIAMLVPVGVFASHSFTDVPDSHTFHTQIGRVAGAAITAGCTATTYCPSANVTRGQMAAFLARSVGRVAADDVTALPMSTTFIDIATVSVKAGDIPGGYANVVVEATASAVNSTLTGCPCGSVFILVNADGDQVGWPAYTAQIVANAFGGGVGSVALSAVVKVPTGVAQTFRLRGRTTIGTAPTTVWGTLAALYVPFEGDGTNALVPVSADVKDDPVARPQD